MNKPEVSSKSMKLIESKFNQLISDTAWVPDWKLTQKSYSGNCENVLVMGCFFQRIFQLEYWPQKEFKLFCLSRAVKNTLINLFDFDSDVVSIVPRYSLFKTSCDYINFPSSDFTLVHSGRISPQKNIEFIIFITFYFQILVSPKINIVLMGDFDNEYHHNLLNIKTCNYQDKIYQLINSLPWIGNKPQIINNLSSDDWCSHVPDKGLIFSASNLIYEDFSVAVAQAQELGLPCLLPYWGGFKDVIGSNIKFYDSNLIGSSNESFSLLSLKAKLFVQSYMSNTLFLQSKLGHPQPDLKNPNAINLSYLEKKINDNIKRWGPEIRHIIEGNFHLFVKSENGVKFFSEYNRIFS